MSTLLKALKILFLLLLVWLSLNVAASFLLTAPKPENIPHGRTFFFQDVEEVLLHTSDGFKIAAWYLPNGQQEEAVILLNGKGGNRKGLIKRAKYYLDKGKAVFMPDLRATGESTGDMITMGWQEKNDLLASYQFLQDKAYSSIAAHGLSLGAATIVYSLDSLSFEYLVLESCYDNIDQALANRLHAYYLPSFFLVVTEYLTEWRMGVEARQLRPEDYMHLAQAPTLFLAGDSEQKVRKQETEKMFQQCASENKQLHFFKGGIHEDFMNRYQQEWENVMDDWLTQLNVYSNTTGD